MIPLGYPADSLQILIEGEKVSKELGDGKSLAIFYSRMGHYYALREGNPRLGKQYSEKCFKEAEKLRDVEILAPVACDLCISNHCLGEYLNTVHIAPQVISLLEDTHRESEFFGRAYNVYALLQTYYGHGLGMLGNFEEGNDLCQKALQYALHINHLYGIALVELFYAALLFSKGDGKNIIERAKNSIRYCEECKGLLILGLTWTALGSGYYFLGDLDAARRHIEKGMKIQGDAGIAAFMSLHYCFLGMVDLDSGNLKNARSSVEEALRLSSKNMEKWIEGISRTLLGRILGKSDPAEVSRAEECIVRGIQILDELQIRPYSSQGRFFLGELYGDMGQRENSLRSLKKAEGEFRQMGMDYWLAKTQEVLERL
jgi:tetratricopeptide (TPR) repeat protein